MIEKDVELTIERTELKNLIVEETCSCFPEKFHIYYDLLVNNPEQDVEPIVSVPHPEYEKIRIIRNGKHRYLSSILAGRKDILNIVVRKRNVA